MQTDRTAKLSCQLSKLRFVPARNRLPAERSNPRTKLFQSRVARSGHASILIAYISPLDTVHTVAALRQEEQAKARSGTKARWGIKSGWSRPSRPALKATILNRALAPEAR